MAVTCSNHICPAVSLHGLQSPRGQPVLSSSGWAHPALWVKLCCSKGRDNTCHSALRACAWLVASFLSSLISLTGVGSRVFGFLSEWGRCLLNSCPGFALDWAVLDQVHGSGVVPQAGQSPEAGWTTVNLKPVRKDGSLRNAQAITNTM